MSPEQLEHYRWAASVGREARDMQPQDFEDYREAAKIIVAQEAEIRRLRGEAK